MWEPKEFHARSTPELDLAKSQLLIWKLDSDFLGARFCLPSPSTIQKKVEMVSISDIKCYVNIHDR